MTHICVGKLTIIGSNNGLSPGRRQAIIWTNAGILFIEPLGTNFSEILIVIQIFSFKKMRLKMSSAKWRPFCPGLNVLKGCSKLIYSVKLLSTVRNLNNLNSNRTLNTIMTSFSTFHYIFEFSRNNSCSIFQAGAMQIHPLYLMMPVTIATSLAFMLPVATPPNAMVFAYGTMKIIDMVRYWLEMHVYLDMQNCFENDKSCIHFLNHIFDLAWLK